MAKPKPLATAAGAVSGAPGDRGVSKRKKPASEASADGAKGKGKQPPPPKAVAASGSAPAASGSALAAVVQPTADPAEKPRAAPVEVKGAGGYGSQGAEGGGAQRAAKKTGAANEAKAKGAGQASGGAVDARQTRKDTDAAGGGAKAKKEAGVGKPGAAPAGKAGAKGGAQPTASGRDKGGKTAAGTKRNERSKREGNAVVAAPAPAPEGMRIARSPPTIPLEDAVAEEIEVLPNADIEDAAFLEAAARAAAGGAPAPAAAGEDGEGYDEEEREREWAARREHGDYLATMRFDDEISFEERRPTELELTIELRACGYGPFADGTLVNENKLVDYADRFCSSVAEMEVARELRALREARESEAEAAGGAEAARPQRGSQRAKEAALRWAKNGAAGYVHGAPKDEGPDLFAPLRKLVGSLAPPDRPGRYDEWQL